MAVFSAKIKTMDITGSIIKVLPVQTGVTKSGNEWRRGGILLRTLDRYPQDVCLNLWNQKIEAYPLREGDRVKVYFDASSREYNGRYYTELTVWKVEALGDAPTLASLPAGGAATAAAAVLDQIPQPAPATDLPLPEQLPF